MSKFTISTVFSAIDKMTGPVGSMTRKVDQLGSSAEKATKMLREDFAKAGAQIASIAGVGIAAGAAVFGLATKASAAADSINDTAMSLGLASDALQEYRYIANLAGMSSDDMDKALTKLTVNLGKGGSEVDEAIASLGLSIDQLKAAGPDRVLELVADGMKGISDPTRKAAITTQLFGKSSVRMVNALSEGSEGLAKLREEAHKTGYVMSEEAVKAGADMGDQMDRLKMSFEGLTNGIGSKLFPKITALIDKITAGIQPGGKLANVATMLTSALSTMAVVGGAALDVIIGLLNFIAPLTPVILGIVGGIVAYNTAMAIYEAVTTAAAVAQMVMNGAMTANPIGIVVVAIGALIGIVVLLVKNWDAVVNVLKIVWESVKGLGQAFLKYLLLPINLVMDAIGGLIRMMAKIPGLGDKLGPVADALDSVQAKMNKTLTGVEGAYDFVGVAENTRDNIAAVGKPPAPVSSKPTGSGVTSPYPVSSQTSSIVATSKTVENRSTLDVNFNNTPPGTTSKQTGKAPAVKLNMGYAGAR